MVNRLLYCVGRGLANQGLGDIAAAAVAAVGNPAVAAVVVANLIGKVAAEAWKAYRDEQKLDDLHADVVAVAKMGYADAREQAVAIARQVAPDDPELQGHIERFVTLVPAAVNQTLRRPDDPTGTTLPPGTVFAAPDDLARLLPARLPRFKPGDAPPYLNGWELVRQLGAGGFGEVWLARNPEDDGLLAAVKFGLGLSEAEQALLNEGDVLNQVRRVGRHPGIVELLDRRTRGVEVPWLRYEYVPGGDLTGLIHRWQALPPADRLTKVLAALRDLAETVGHFHRLTPAVVHRDLKPSNILVDDRGGSVQLKVTDFGIGAVSAKRLLDGERAGTASGAFRLNTYLRGAHTPLYASPQQRAGATVTDPRDDVHALGVIGYQMFTGLLDQGAGPDFADDLKVCGAPDAVAELLGRCVRRKPEQRPRDAGELAGLLAEAADRGKRTMAPPPAPPAPQPRPGPPQPARQVLTVDSSGTGSHREIADAVAAAKPGTLICVRPGVYRKPVVIDKNVEIAGDGPRERIVLETTDVRAIHLTADEATVRGLTVRVKDGKKDAKVVAIWITHGKPLVENCDISSDLLAGVEVQGAGTAPTVRGCKIHDGKGVFVWEGAGGLIEDCDVFGNALAGVEVKGAGTAPTVRGCKIHDGKQGGVFVWQGAGGVVEDCDVFGNALAGVEVQGAGTAPTVRGCRINRNKYQAINVHGKAGGTVENCDLTGNKRGAWVIEDGCTVTKRNNKE